MSLKIFRVLTRKAKQAKFSLPFECLTSHTLSVCLCIHVYHSLAHYLVDLPICGILFEESLF